MKKVISILLSALLILSCFSFSVFAQTYKPISVNDALAQYEAETGEKVETNRYYFLMPNGENGDLSDNEYNTFTSESNYAKSWYNEYTDTAGIYWWDSGVYDPAEWAGYLMDKADADSVFYADIPEAVTTIIFNNAIDGGMDKEDPLYYLAQQTINVPCEYYDAGESDNYPNGTESFNNMIFVVDPDLIPVSDLSLKSTYGGEWYYYYGDGCYGFEKNGDYTNCIRDDHDHSKKSVKEAIAEYEAVTGEKVETNRYYFLMPNGKNGEKSDDETELLIPYGEYAESWYNEYSTGAGIYWWDSGVADPYMWPGYKMEKSSVSNIYYADVPKAVTTVIFNNYVNGGMDSELPIFWAAHQSSNICCDYYAPGESKIYPDGLDSFDNMIFVVDPDMCWSNNTVIKDTHGGEWYYYYKNGCYGTVKNGDKDDCIRHDHNHETPSMKSVKDAISEYEAQTGEKIETNRYYFLMPNGENGQKGDDDTVDAEGFHYSLYYDQYTPSWYNEYTTGDAGIFWWDSGIADPPLWTGYKMEKDDAECVFYADVPKAVTTIIFNNNVNGGMDHEADIYYKTQQSMNVMCEYYDVGESETYPDGLDSFDNMIYVIDPDLCYYLIEMHGKPTWGGEWYYYYGDGCYSTDKDGDVHNCIRDDHKHDADETLGDVDGDGVVSILDATAIQRDIAKLQALTVDEKAKADLDGDGEVTVLDATAIQMIVAKLD